MGGFAPILLFLASLGTWACSLLIIFYNMTIDIVMIVPAARMLCDSGSGTFSVKPSTDCSCGIAGIRLHPPAFIRSPLSLRIRSMGARARFRRRIDPLF